MMCRASEPVQRLDPMRCQKRIYTHSFINPTRQCSRKRWPGSQFCRQHDKQRKEKPSA